MMALSSRRALLCGIAVLPVMGGTAGAASSDLARSCEWAAQQRVALDRRPMLDLPEDLWEVELSRFDIAFRRAISEPSASLSDLKAKARMLLADLQEGGALNDEHDDQRLIGVVLREVIELCA